MDTGLIGRGRRLDRPLYKSLEIASSSRRAGVSDLSLCVATFGVCRDATGKSISRTMPLFNILSDTAIDTLINAPKPIPNGLHPITKKMISRNQSGRVEFDVDCPTGDRFVVMVRQNEINPLNFSVILGYRIPGFNTIFRLRRYNGKHSHCNPIESAKFRDFHKHTATERYQKLGAKEDHFAEADTRFGNLSGAIQCLLEDNGFEKKHVPLPLFD